MAYTTILHQVDDRIARIALSRPKKMNALSLKLCAEFQDALAIADYDPEVRVAVVTGAGGHAFSAGFDFDDEDENGRERRTIEDWKRRHNRDVKFNFSVFECSKPVIAMIDGYCLAGALEFAQCVMFATALTTRDSVSLRRDLPSEF
ncbi:enoyl-CoA hydratase/carnithine racemase [Bradyrhizobium japonicum]